MRPRISVRGERTFRQELTDVSDFARIWGGDPHTHTQCGFLEHAHLRRGEHCPRTRFIGGVICPVASKNATGARFNLNRANIFGMTHTSQKLQAVFARHVLRNINKSQSTRCCSILWCPRRIAEPHTRPRTGTRASAVKQRSAPDDSCKELQRVRARARGPTSQSSKGCLNSHMRAIITAFPCGRNFISTHGGICRTAGADLEGSQPHSRLNLVHHTTSGTFKSFSRSVAAAAQSWAGRT